MHKTVNKYEFIHELLTDEYASWTQSAAAALFEYLEQYEQDTDSRVEFDRVALRCEYSEYDSAWDAMQQYQPEDMPVEGDEGDDLVEIQEKNEAAALAWLEDRTTVIPFDGTTVLSDGTVLGHKGIIIAQF